MELLLNLAWLLLAVPAYSLWRHSRGPIAGRKLSALQCLLALACVLVILFPVVSATDDLRAMRAEMEESPASKRSISRSSTGERSLNWKWQTPPALHSATPFFVAFSAVRLTLLTPDASIPFAPPLKRAARAPPRFSA